MEEMLKRKIFGESIHIKSSYIWTGCMLLVIVIGLRMCIMAENVNDRMFENFEWNSKSVVNAGTASLYFGNMEVKLAERKAVIGTIAVQNKGDRISGIEFPAVTVRKPSVLDMPVVEEMVVEELVVENLEEEEVEKEEETEIEIPGFVINESGYITGVELSLVDGVLVLPTDARCKGILAGAFSGIEEEVMEICIPANIIYIEPGALDVLEHLFYIKVLDGNPSYYSEKGVLFRTDGTLVVYPKGRTKK